MPRFLPNVGVERHLLRERVRRLEAVLPARLPAVAERFSETRVRGRRAERRREALQRDRATAIHLSCFGRALCGYPLRGYGRNAGDAVGFLHL